MCLKLQITAVKSFGDFCQVYYHNLYFVRWSPISDFNSVFDSRKILTYTHILISSCPWCQR